MKIAIIDNYDSFTYNLCHAVEAAGAKIDVMRNDHIDMRRVAASDKIILSPGPGIPSEAGDMPEVLERFAFTKPILGVCLGHQAIGEHFGARLENLAHVFHGVQTPISLGDDYLFESLPRTIEAGRYHSWVVSREGLPDELEITALSDEGQIMALRHRMADIRGLQFHPESILTPQGGIIIRNWINH